MIGNPAPAHGGRTCVGPDRFEMYCSNLPPCPEPRSPSIDGGWGPFGAWSKCTASCGGGFRLRRRICDRPRPQNGGIECIGCNIDYETCNTQPCPETQKLGPWTPWFQQTSNSTSNGEYLEKRFRYICKFNGTDAKVVKAKEENRVCVSDGSCHRVGEENIELGFVDRTSWSRCTVTCGGGQQYRTEGTKMVSRVCNPQPCEGLMTFLEF